MTLEILATKSFVQALKWHPHPNIVKNKILILSENPLHPSLNVHLLRKVKGRSIWDCYISDSERLLYEIKDGMLRLWDLGSHSIVDKVHLREFAGNKSFMPVASTLKKPSIGLVQNNSNEDKGLEYPTLFDSSDANLENQEISEILPEELFNPFSFFDDAHLRILGVPASLISSLKDAPSLDNALSVVDLDEVVRTRFEDVYTTAKLHKAMFDESLLRYHTSIEDLEGYYGGRLKELLLNLNLQQKQCVNMGNFPLTIIKGTAGSGKTAVGIYRAIRLAKQGRHVLLVTFNKNLSTSTESLVKSLCGDIPKNLEVVHLHRIMWKILHGQAIDFGNALVGKELQNFIRKSLIEVRTSHTSTILQRDEQFFEEEITHVIKGLDIQNFDEYRRTVRSGLGRGLQPKEREAIWQVYLTYRALLKRANRYDWAEVARLVLKVLKTSSPTFVYDDIIVDEAQDLTIIDRQILQHLVAPFNKNKDVSSSIMVLADTAQSLYSRKFPWEQISEQTKLKQERLEKNYRNTRQIAEAAVYLLENNASLYRMKEYINPELTTRNGPSPILVTLQDQSYQVGWICERIKDLVSDGSFHFSDFAILCRTHDLCLQCIFELGQAELPTTYQGEDLKLLEKSVKVMTFHSAKGLEFPVVFLPGLIKDQMPLLMDQEDEDLQQENLERERTLCYVGMTRASDGLYLLTVKGEESLFVQELEGKVIPW